RLRANGRNRRRRPCRVWQRYARIDRALGVRQLSRPAAIGARPSRSWLYAGRERQNSRRQLCQGICRNADLRTTASDHTQRRVGQRDSAVLLDDADPGADETAAGPAAAQPRFDYLALGMDCVTGEDRVLDIELHMEKSKA